MNGLAPSLASSRRQSTILDFDVLSRVSEKGESIALSDGTETEKGYERISADLANEGDSIESDSDDVLHLNGNTAEAEKEKGKEKGRRSRLWPFKRKQKWELKVHGPVKELLDRALWTMQTGHRAVGVCCCDQCCDCGDQR